jgi:hypothetical protein
MRGRGRSWRRRGIERAWRPSRFVHAARVAMRASSAGGKGKREEAAYTGPVHLDFPDAVARQPVVARHKGDEEVERKHGVREGAEGECPVADGSHIKGDEKGLSEEREEGARRARSPDALAQRTVAGRGPHVRARKGCAGAADASAGSARSSAARAARDHLSGEKIHGFCLGSSSAPSAFFKSFFTRAARRASSAAADRTIRRAAVFGRPAASAPGQAEQGGRAAGGASGVQEALTTATDRARAPWSWFWLSPPWSRAAPPNARRPPLRPRLPRQARSPRRPWPWASPLNLFAS